MADHLANTRLLVSPALAPEVSARSRSALSYSAWVRIPLSRMIRSVITSSVGDEGAGAVWACAARAVNAAASITTGSR